jgi:hypothetical protein
LNFLFFLGPETIPDAMFRSKQKNNHSSRRTEDFRWHVSVPQGSKPLKLKSMKTILTVAIVIALLSCSAPREFQAEMVKAELVKIDTVFRYADPPKQLLTWRDDNLVDYVTYAPLNNYFTIGAKMIVLVKR